MEQSVDFKKIEQKSHKLIQQDGLEMIGYGLLQCIMALDFYGITNLLPVIAAAVLIPLAMRTIRGKVTYPRVGYAKFGKKPGEILLPIIIGAAAVVLLILVTSGIKWLGDYIPLYLGGALAAWSHVNARTVGENIWYVFTALYLISGAGIILFHLEPLRACAIQLWVVAPILTVVGIIKLYRFLRNYPKPSMEPARDAR